MDPLTGQSSALGQAPQVYDITEGIVNSTPCPSCAEPEARYSAITVALVTIIAVIVIYYLVGLGVDVVRRREGFVSPQAFEVAAQSRELFSKSDGKATYSEYKTSVAAADPVQYDAVKGLWKSGKLTPKEVQKVL